MVCVPGWPLDARLNHLAAGGAFMPDDLESDIQATAGDITADAHVLQNDRG